MNHHIFVKLFEFLRQTYFKLFEFSRQNNEMTSSAFQMIQRKKCPNFPEVQNELNFRAKIIWNY